MGTVKSLKENEQRMPVRTLRNSLLYGALSKRIREEKLQTVSTLHKRQSDGAVGLPSQRMEKNLEAR